MALESVNLSREINDIPRNSKDVFKNHANNFIKYANDILNQYSECSKEFQLRSDKCRRYQAKRDCGGRLCCLVSCPFKLIMSVPQTFLCIFSCGNVELYKDCCKGRPLNRSCVALDEWIGSLNPKEPSICSRYFGVTTQYSCCPEDGCSNYINVPTERNYINNLNQEMTRCNQVIETLHLKKIDKLLASDLDIVHDVSKAFFTPKRTIDFENIIDEARLIPDTFTMISRIMTDEFFIHANNTQKHRQCVSQFLKEKKIPDAILEHVLLDYIIEIDEEKNNIATGNPLEIKSKHEEEKKYAADLDDQAVTFNIWGDY